ncbi:chromosomal replication initiator protein DnaA [Candidatus Kinetoplastidibacterium crithidiae]|uniref:Chromosomal replication initiator protein DnaA n=1 Tax=Candidatus Kinetoplastidibacterium crithidiae TCC036E TaxID=1208918 RepID=M1M568_9PROT|nr:chromosomal replication initiator protein DnaA [Candidatus Kinetoplastibacterium crithidii]AFZ83028.1 chromosomal replication initiation protein [Candidatus Kinetoplastibacterium crithidii (ex Angomonas deanei ATCC 30255)]AGF47305.1 chromosomal replication initiator protein dnaA [Candidatus Kinetoplastibacterium crithidii TCC036E]
MNNFWLTFIAQMEKDLPPQQINAWIKPLAPVSFNEAEGILTILAPNRFKLDLVRKKFGHQIEKIAYEWFKKPIKIIFELPSSTKSKSFHESNFLSNEKDNNTTNLVKSNDVNNIYITGETISAPQVDNNTLQTKNVPVENVGIYYERSKLNSILTFDNFVTGKANQLARAAALQVSENPGVSYNPLFLYGGVGLGKTHLIHAVGNSMISDKYSVKVRYVHADQYVSDVVKAYQRKAFDEFKRYYHSLDLLLIDDIQFFSGKNRTQEEFFYAFEAMVAQHKQIIITSDTYPKELSGIDSRLISRFDSGLTVAIEPPELEMRVAILLRKASTEGIPMPEEVAFFIAKHLRSNVRELEGALRKVLAYARFHGRDVLTVDVCKEALKDLLSVSNGQITVENIQKTVADFYKIKVADMYSKRRPANIAMPRQIAMYLAKELTQKSLPEIGDLFGGRDHTTVLHAVRKISEARIKQSDLNHTLHVLEQTLKG